MEAALNIARAQFAVTTLFHMVWALLGIGLSFFMVVLEAFWLRTGNEVYLRHVRFWSSIFIVAFGIGVASGIPLEFQFGANWSQFSADSGQIMGNLLAFEGATAFALEAAFLALFVFGWDRVGKRVHMFSAVMVALGATLSAFWIMSANSWMQTPAGVTVAAGKISVTDYAAAIFNPSFPISFAHTWVASVESAVFVMGGVCAWYILRNHNTAFFLSAFKILIVAGIVLAPLQVYLGDASGREVVKNQPAKAAAMEAHWQTNRPGTSAAWAAVAWPNPKAQDNSWEITIPYALSLLSTHSLNGQVTGLKAFPIDQQPPVAIPFYSFRLMVLLGFVMVAAVLWALWLWLRKRLRSDNVGQNRWFLKFWVYAFPSGILATEFGWAVREVGRQPWIIYGIMKTSAGVSTVGTIASATSLALFIAVYVALSAVFVFFVIRILRKGPDLSEPLPAQFRRK